MTLMKITRLYWRDVKPLLELKILRTVTIKHNKQVKRQYGPPKS